MKKTMFAIITLIIGIVAGNPGFAADQVENPADCIHCGMNRTQFAHSRMVIQYEDGSSVGTCSINCVAIDLDMHPEKKVKAIMVADYTTKKLIDAKTAFWVMGGSKKGVMTKNAKWAFATEAAAQAFIKEYGGTPAKFDEVLKAAKENKMGGMKHKAPMAGKGN